MWPTKAKFIESIGETKTFLKEEEISPTSNCHNG
jgi:hypothetical protein